MEIEKKINYINDRVAKVRLMADKRPMSPPKDNNCDYGDITPIGSIRRGSAVENTSAERTEKDPSRLMTAGATISMEKRRARKSHITNRPSVSQGYPNFRVP